MLLQGLCTINRIKINKKSLKKNLNETIVTYPEKELFFFDESRFGTHSKIGHGWFKKGIRTQVKVKLGRQNFYLYSAVNPRNRESSSLFVPNVNTDCMNIFLEQMSYQTSLLGRQIEYTINSLKPPFIGGKHSFSFVSLLLRIGITIFRNKGGISCCGLCRMA
ncbi:transposase [Wolbachia endosymbiont of Zygogramma bicolorata]|uniref:transposase n=1 Tax=Wolbachia endosymbiont of Zygogramma bicolorata TaxID=3134048 RepID=UPI003DA90EF3